MKRFEVYNRAIAYRFNDAYIEVNYIETSNNKPNIELWEDLAGDDEIFHEEFGRVITNEDTPEGVIAPSPITLLSVVSRNSVRIA